MKTTKLTLVLAGIMLASAFIISSCKKKSTETTATPPADTDTQAAQDNNMAEQHSNDAFAIGGQASESGSVAYRLGGGGASVLGGATISPMTPGASSYTVTFNGTVCNDGKIRSGQLLLSMNPSAPYFRNPGFTCTITTTTVNPYIVDNYTVAINKTITNTTPSTFTTTSTNMTWSVSASVSVTKPSGGGTVNWSCNRTHTLLNTLAPYTIGGTTVQACYAGQSTPIYWQGAVLSINGSTNGTSASGVAFTANSTNVIRNYNCTPNSARPAQHPFVAGTIAFTPSGKATRTIDFGTGTCDLAYTIIINGTTYGPFYL